MDVYEKLMELARRRGFIWSSNELYGGLAGFYDYGPLGAALKRRLETLWREFYVVREGFSEIEVPTIGAEEVFVASGHVGGFSDPLVGCTKCGEDFRADHLVENLGLQVPQSLEEIQTLLEGVRCPECGGTLGKVYEFNLMFKTSIGPGSKRAGYLRPETAQGIFINFPRLFRFHREKLPFGVVQIGRAYRNEISPRQGPLRLREFTQAECEIFLNPDQKNHPRFQEVADRKLRLYPAELQPDGNTTEYTLKEAVETGIIAHEFLAYHLYLVQSFLTLAGVNPDRLRFRQHREDEMAHYAKDCWDAEALSERFGWVELVGIADRTDYDLKSHAKASGKDLSVNIHYPEPREVEKLTIKPNLKLLGPKFKGRAKEILNALKQLEPDQLERLSEEVREGKKLTIELEDGTVELEPELVKLERVKTVEYGENRIPHVLEPSYGLDRLLYMVLEHNYHEEEVGGEKRVVLRLPEYTAPVQVAVLPLLTREELTLPAQKIATELRQAGLEVDYDESGTIGRRYRRNDEVGTPLAVTIDYETLENNTVTVRERDTMKQTRISTTKLTNFLKEKLDWNQM